MGDATGTYECQVCGVSTLHQHAGIVGIDVRVQRLAHALAAATQGRMPFPAEDCAVAFRGMPAQLRTQVWVTAAMLLNVLDGKEGDK